MFDIYAWTCCLPETWPGSSGPQLCFPLSVSSTRLLALCPQSCLPSWPCYLENMRTELPLQSLQLPGCAISLGNAIPCALGQPPCFTSIVSSPVGRSNTNCLEQTLTHGSYQRQPLIDISRDSALPSWGVCLHLNCAQSGFIQIGISKEMTNGYVFRHQE